MSDLLEAAAESLGTPPSLVQRSAAARAEADGTDIDTILAAWAGGEAPTKPAGDGAEPAAEDEAPAAEQADTDSAETEADDQAEEEAEPAAPVITAPPVVEVPEAVPEPAYQPQPDLEPVPLGRRLQAAARVGASTGAALGLVGFLLASTYWAPTAIIAEGETPAVVVGGLGLVLVIAAISVIFGAIVASMSRAAVSWANPAMELSSSKTSTTWVGASLGLILGLVGGGVLFASGTPVEGTDGLVQLPVLPTFIVMLVGGAILGAITAAVPQLLGTPVAVDEEESEEAEEVKARLADALGVPMAGLALLALLVLPFAFVLIQSNHLLPGAGAAVVGILTAGGILGFAALAGNRPQVRISLGDVLVALAGIGAVLIVIVAVLFYSGDAADHDAEEEEGGDASIVLVL